MPRPIVATQQGPIEGTEHEGYARFLGVPYAASPAGALRFRPPAPAPLRAGVLDASWFGPRAPQPPSALESVLGGGREIDHDESALHTLNVWTPGCDARRRPVMVWIHGGAFLWGSSASPWYDGERFAVDHDVVLVSINYRLGALGFTHLEGLLGDAYAGSGTLGNLDQATALRWVRDHVAAFGGDPDNVTIFGESAGAMSIATLLAYPAAKGLFHKAILQSGAAWPVIDAPTGTQRAKELCEELGVAPEGLLGADIDELLAAQERVMQRRLEHGPAFCPVVDGSALPVDPLEAVARGAAVDVPLLIGTNRHEWRLFSFLDPAFVGIDDAVLPDRVAAHFPGDPAQAVAAYRATLEEPTPSRVLESVMTDVVFAMPALRLAAAQHAAGGVAWTYLLTLEARGIATGLGACHGLDLPLVFNTVDAPNAELLLGDAPPRELASKVNATWAAFARTGDPASGALGEWPPWTPPTRTTKLIGEAIELADDPLAASRELWGA